MPIYMYTCSACKQVLWQGRRPSNGDSLRPCPKCRSGSLIRNIGAMPNLPGLTPNHPSSLPPPNERRSNFVVNDVAIVNFPTGTGIKAEGNVNIQVDNYAAINIQYAFDLTRGARVEGTKIVHKAPRSIKKRKHSPK
jgi:putative FmdB family regulatory protein